MSNSGYCDGNIVIDGYELQNDAGWPPQAMTADSACAAREELACEAQRKEGLGAKELDP